MEIAFLFGHARVSFVSDGGCFAYRFDLTDELRLILKAPPRSFVWGGGGIHGQ